MNAFRKLVLAPALLGLMSPLAASAQSLEMGTLDRYTQQQDIDRMRALEAQMGQVTSVSQFSDVQPTDWAYQALANLVEQYGCVAGYPDGTFRGNRALSRYEAAALLNACLDRVTEMTAEIKRLMKEFEKELVVLKAKVDGLEAQTAELAATQFSTTTKLSGKAYFWLGGAAYSGSKSGESPLAPSGDPKAEQKAYSDAIKSNSLAVTPGGINANFNTVSAAPYTVLGGNFKTLTKATTWSGFTGSGANAWTAAGNANTFNGNTFTSYGNANLANITVAGSTTSLAGLTGGAAVSLADNFLIPGTTTTVVNAAGPTGQLGVNGLLANGFNAGTPGFKENLNQGTLLTPKQIKRSGNSNGLTSSGVTLSTFTLGAKDMANLVRLGNASRRAKGADMLTYQSNVVANGPVNGTAFTTNGYQIATGGEFLNNNIYTDPFNASIAEYGTLSKFQANRGFVKNAARKLLKGLYRGNVELGEAVSFNFDTRIDFNTSFTGKDLLRTRFRSGNFADTTWSGTPFPATGAEIAYEEGEPKQFNVNRIFYQFPVGENFTVTAGPVVRQDDMLAVWPSQYPAETIMDFFTYAGAPGTYTLNLGAGAGVFWNKDNWSVSANYVAKNGQSSFTNRGGIANEASGGTGTAQLAYTAADWNLTAAYAYNQNGSYGYIPVGTPLAGNPFGGLSGFDVSSVAISGWYAPSNWGQWMPSVSAGWGYNSYNATQDASIWGVAAVNAGDQASSQSWYVGLQWSDVLLAGNYFGTAVGQPTFISSNDSFLESDSSTFAWEIWYKFQVTDNLAVTPAFFYINNPSGLGSNSVSGGVLKTSISF